MPGLKKRLCVAGGGFQGLDHLHPEPRRQPEQQPLDYRRVLLLHVTAYTSSGTVSTAARASGNSCSGMVFPL